MRSKLDVKIGAGRPGPARENQAVPQVVGFQHVAGRHIDLTHGDGRHTRTAAAFPHEWGAPGLVRARVEQRVDQALTAGPAQTMSLTIQFDFDMGDFWHQPMSCAQRRRARTHARWSAKLAGTVR